MSRTTATRRELVDAIIAQCRTNSTGTVLLHTAVAERLGLNPSDHKCADLMLSQSGPCTPGRLAELTGLSTGAITGVIDRLERAGFLVREHDPDDRRRVLLRLTHTRAPDMHKLFLPLQQKMAALCENYTIAELAIVLRFLREILVVSEDVAELLRNSPPLAAVAADAAPAAASRNEPARRGSAGRRAARGARKAVARAR